MVEMGFSDSSCSLVSGLFPNIRICSDMSSYGKVASVKRPFFLPLPLKVPPVFVLVSVMSLVLPLPVVIPMDELSIGVPVAALVGMPPKVVAVFAKPPVLAICFLAKLPVNSLEKEKGVCACALTMAIAALTRFFSA